MYAQEICNNGIDDDADGDDPWTREREGREG